MLSVQSCNQKLLHFLTSAYLAILTIQQMQSSLPQKCLSNLPSIAAWAQAYRISKPGPAKDS